MKKAFLIVIVAFLFSNSQSFSQTIDLSADSIAVLLCKKWEADYVLMGNMKITPKPGAAQINYQFNKDKTFLLTISKKKETTNGTWVFDSKKKIIKLTVNGKPNSSIISLKEKEMIMLVDTKEATPDDPMQLKAVYKVKP